MSRTEELLYELLTDIQFTLDYYEQVYGNCYIKTKKKGKILESIEFGGEEK